MDEARGGAVPAGTWVEIDATLMEGGQRPVSAPDTAATPLVGRVRGFTVSEARPGEPCEVVTLAGRRLSGRLSVTAPRHDHGFGRTEPQLVGLGLRLRGARP